MTTLRNQGRFEPGKRLPVVALLLTAFVVAAANDPPEELDVEAAAQPYNVLFISIDDLRPMLGCYGDASIETPHIDRLAAAGTVFDRAYCQQAICAPSRSSVLTGRRPDATRVWDVRTHFRDALPDVVTLPQLFKENGYHTVGFGKVYHDGRDDEASWSNGASWSPKPFVIRNQLFQKHGKGSAGRRENRDLEHPAWASVDASESEFVDGMIADKAIEVLSQVGDGELAGKPLFLAVGFHKPHLPFTAPKKFFDLYAPSEIELPENRYPPEDAPGIALYGSLEIRKFSDVPEHGKLSEATARGLIRAYKASTSFVDAQVGRVMAALEVSGIADQTIVVLWGDHGWKLGEHAMWGKMTNYELDCRAPLIVRVPGQTPAKTEALVELVDIYPTLAEICGLIPPADLEGRSFLPLIEDPGQEWKDAAFSQYPRVKTTRMGYSIKTDRYRYTEWLPFDEETATVVGAPVAVELYDHDRDPGENANLAGLEENAELVESLSARLDRGRGWNRSIAPAGVERGDPGGAR